LRGIYILLLKNYLLTAKIYRDNTLHHWAGRTESTLNRQMQLMSTVIWIQMAGVGR